MLAKSSGIGGTGSRHSPLFFGLSLQRPIEPRLGHSTAARPFPPGYGNGPMPSHATIDRQSGAGPVPVRWRTVGGNAMNGALQVYGACDTYGVRVL